MRGGRLPGRNESSEDCLRCLGSDPADEWRWRWTRAIVRKPDWDRDPWGMALNLEIVQFVGGG